MVKYQWLTTTLRLHLDVNCVVDLFKLSFGDRMQPAAVDNITLTDDQLRSVIVDVQCKSVAELVKSVSLTH